MREPLLKSDEAERLLGFESLSFRVRTTQHKGDIAVAKAIAYFTSSGYDVSIPLTESAPYDLIVDANEALARVQVKYCSAKNRILDLRHVHSNAQGYVVSKTKAGVYDWLYVLDGEGNEYVLRECLSERSAVSLSVLPKAA